MVVQAVVAREPPHDRLDRQRGNRQGSRLSNGQETDPSADDVASKPPLRSH